MLKIRVTKPTTLRKALPLKNRTKTYLLLISVLCIWGIIGFKMVSALGPEGSELQSQELLVNFKPKPMTENDTFSITPVLRDPFLGTIKKKAIAHTGNRPIKDTLVWPKVTYSGMVRKQNASVQVFVLNIDAYQYLLKKGQRIKDIILVGGNSEHIVIAYKNRKQTIALQK